MKNPRSARWSYQRVVDQIEAVYGPCSEHAAIGSELRQGVRGRAEALQTLKDVIYEKVFIVHAELEQDTISVDIFTNTLADAAVMLLEYQKNSVG